MIDPEMKESVDYRQYVTGMRLILVGFALTGFGGSVLGGLLQLKALTIIVVLAGFSMCAVGFVLGVAGYFCIYRDYFIAETGKFALTAVRDIFRGVPRVQ